MSWGVFTSTALTESAHYQNSQAGDLAWAGTTLDGSKSVDEHCDNWTADGDPFHAQASSVSDCIHYWTDYHAFQFCTNTARLYCFED